MKHIALLVIVLMAASAAQAGIVYTVKEMVQGTDVDLQNAGLLIQTDIDDACIDYADATMTAAGDTPKLDGGANWVHDLGSYPDWGVYDRKILVAVKDLTSLLPTTSDQIISAKLVICRSNPWSAGEIVNAHQVTTDWLYFDGGLNEGYNNDPTTMSGVQGEESDGGVSMAYSYDDGLNTYGWGDGTQAFSSADYNAALAGTFTTGPGDGSTRRYKMDITDLVKAWYDGTANYGVVLMLDENSGGDGNPYFRPSESSGTVSDTDTSLFAGQSGIGDALSFEIELIPEPATMGLLAIGGIAALIRRKRA